MSELIDRLRGTVIPAVVTPMDAEGIVSYDALGAYAVHIAGSSIGGVAVWAHTGRGLHLSAADRSKVLETWRQATDLPIIAGVATVDMAVTAAEHGADAVMVYPHASPPDQAVETHERIAAESGLPLVGFYLHGEAGGYPYPPSLIRELLSLPSMLGVKTATLDQAIGCQDALRASAGTGKLAITGEDRMFGPSFMWGADTALVGIAAAQVPLTTAVVSSWTTGDSTAFLTASARLDRFAYATFYAPIEGYIQRMLWAAVWEGLIPEQAAHDPYGPALPPSERERVINCLNTLH